MTVRIRLLNLLLLSALVFAGFRLWLFLGEPPPSLPAVAPAATAPAPEATEHEQNAEAPAVRPEAYDVIVARDLFSPTRGVVPPAPTAANKPEPKPQPPPKVTLYGVVIIDGEKTAYLVEGTQETRPKKVRENENFAGAVLKTIRPDGVTLLFAGTEINVPLRISRDGSGTPTTSGPSVGVAAPRAGAPVVVPRRRAPTGVQQGQLPVPGRPAGPATRMPAITPPVDPGTEVFGDEEFPEEAMPGDDVPDMPEEEQGN
jgi:hypothetical protein